MNHYQRSSLFGLNIGWVILLTAFPGKIVAADWKERLLSGAPPKWAALENYYSKLEVSYRKIFAVPAEGKPFPLSFRGTITHDVRQNGEMFVATDHHVGVDGKGKRVDTFSVRGMNSRYAFNLAKTSPEAEALVLANFESASEKAGRKARGFGGGEFDTIFKVQGVRLSGIAKDPHFTITDVHGVQRSGREVVQVEYDRQLMRRDKANPSQLKAAGTEHGIVLLEPEHFWCVREYQIDNPDWKINGTLEYGDEVDGFPIIHRNQHKATHKNGLGTMLITYEFDKIVHRDIPESEFTLSAFGLPEMQLPGEQEPRTLWRWLIGIGITLGTLAILMRVHMKKKRHAKQCS